MTKLEIIKWTGNVAMLISSGIVCFFPALAVHWWAFIGYVVGTALWAGIGFRTKDAALAVLNVLFIIINGYGLYVRL